MGRRRLRNTCRAYLIPNFLCVDFNAQTLIIIAVTRHCAGHQRRRRLAGRVED